MTDRSASPAEQAAAEALDRELTFMIADDLAVGELDRLARAVVAALRPILAAKALREFADANRFPSDWIMFRRNDGSGVTVPDLLREVAAGKLRSSTPTERTDR